MERVTDGSIGIAHAKLHEGRADAFLSFGAVKEELKALCEQHGIAAVYLTVAVLVKPEEETARTVDIEVASTAWGAVEVLLEVAPNAMHNIQAQAEWAMKAMSEIPKPERMN